MEKTRPKKKKSKGNQEDNPSFTWKKRAKPHEREECRLKAEEEMQEHCTPFEMFRKVTNLDELINLILVQSNLYAQQNSREFQTNVKKMIWLFWE